MRFVGKQLTLSLVWAQALTLSSAKLEFNNSNRQAFQGIDKQENLARLRVLADCGDKDVSCCDSGTVYGEGYCYDQNKLACTGGLCKNCGGSGELCCATTDGPACDSERHYCAPSGSCKNCGYNGEPCCPHDEGTLRCRDSWRTICDLTATTPTCKDCGSIGEVCCETSKPCESSFSVCDSGSGTCVSCGGSNEVCCPDAQGNGVCDDDIQRRCVADPSGNTLGTCMDCGDSGEVCCSGPNNRLCNSEYLSCSASDVCESCGDNDEPCCPGPDSSTAPGSGFCDDNHYRSCMSDGNGGGVCKQCGENNEPCCHDSKCDSLFSMCNANSICIECGQLGGTCCDGPDGLVCQNDGYYVCKENHVSGSPTCESCGNDGELACKGFGASKCDSEFAFVENGICQPCGEDGEQCCPESTTCKTTGSACIPDSNICWPYHLHPSSSPSISPTSIPSSSPSDRPTVSVAPSNAPSSVPSISPSDSPSVRPTRSLVPTSSPTNSPAPTVLYTTDCPPTSDPWVEVPPSILTITKSNEGALCRIVLVDGNHKIPVARSYDAGDWHQYSGAFANMAVSCDTSACTFDLDLPGQGAKYMMGATEGYVLSNDEIAARFFESATFGMTLSEINSLAANLASTGNAAIADWVQDQMDESVTPPTSLRQFYRKRANAIFEGSSYMGEVTWPCEALTTYRRYAFSDKDYEKFVDITSIAGTSNKRLEIEGRFVTVVEGGVTLEDGTNLADGSYEICSRPDHYIGGEIELKLNGNCMEARFGGVAGNPPVNLDGIADVDVINLDSSEADPIDQDLYQGQTQMLTIKQGLTDPICSTIGTQGPGEVPAVFATFNSTWFVHSPRFKLLENTLSSPIVDGGNAINAMTAGGAVEHEVRCTNVPRTFLNENQCFLSNEPVVCPADGSINSRIVCGSPNEVANDLALGGTQFNGAFDAKTAWGETSTFSTRQNSKIQTWTQVVLSAPDQLRQRMAWALSQILVINGDVLGRDWTEQYLHYYDIFVKHAFGNYRNILKEVSFSPMMAYFLSYHESKSTAYHLSESDTHRHPDENYAREVMQLFTIGLAPLKDDGTEVEGADNTYTNDDIMEYARVWTGFRSQYTRGNIEQNTWDNKIDPMQIIAGWRDVLPKMGLQGRYIGEGYPLCADIPAGHFLRSGAKYRLLGHTSYPELQQEQDREEWVGDSSAQRFKADPSGELYAALCNSDGSGCNYATTVTLSQDLSCLNNECNVDTIRTVEVESGIFYEYIRPACANLAFYENPIKIKMREGGSRTYMCADPRTEEAGTLCCDSAQRGYRIDEYLAERVRFSTAQNRCDPDPTMDMCTRTNVRECTTKSCSGDPYYWTNESCQLKVKIAHDRKIAIVHNVPSESTSVTAHVGADTLTFFRVHWNEVLEVDHLLEQCGTATNMPCSLTADGSCLCDVSVSEYQAFYTVAPPTKESVLALPYGAYQPSGQKTAVTGMSDVWVYGNGPYTKETVFEVVDDFGMTQLRKNMRSTVYLFGPTPTLEFPTPVHLMSLAEENERDALYETDAALDHYFYHPNTAPFLAYRFAQRFGESNPTPAYVKAITRAFKDGEYINEGTTYGSGQYGDLGASLAAVLLHSEARNTLLEADSVRGAFREPLLKLIQIMKTFEFGAVTGAPLTKFNELENTIRQMFFEAPDVFSFFQPDFEPQGIIGASSMVSPEAAVMNAPEIFSSVNGFQSLIKYGLMDCNDGFGYRHTLDGTVSQSCWNGVTMGDYQGSSGHLTSIPDGALTPQQVVDQLSLLMTSGRLSSASRALIQQEYEDKLAATADHALATIRAQQLIFTTPEFHTTGRVTPNSGTRPEPTTPTPTSNPYKAVVLLMLNGGCDSFNMIVPHTCTGSTLVDQYEQERGELALTATERAAMVIDMAGQPCEKFALHPQLQTVKQLYDDGDLSFYFNTGVLNAPTSNTNYKFVTETRLFAHDTMQWEAKRIDPFNLKVGTGVLGRLSDVLSTRGYQPSSISIDVSSVAVTGYTGRSVAPTVVNSNGVIDFHPKPGSEADIKVEAQLLNGNNELWSSSIFGESWSERFTRALWETDVLESFLADVTLPPPPNYSLAESFETVLKLMMIQNDRASDRDVFFVSLGGFDTHDDMKVRLDERFDHMDSSLNYFQQNLKAQGLWNNVTIVTVSDFGRTMTPNSGEGSDHGWGGNYIVTGGGVKGGQGFCNYPSDITATSPWNVGRGRILPGCAWESMWNPIVEWMLDGQLSNAERNEILVNAVKTGTPLYGMADLFD
ncbi:hypothetical protein ACA910_013399 [Epithemia clementina (nom. ined.)]